MSLKEDLLLLPEVVHQAAKIEPNGEVNWPLNKAAQAINALAQAGFVVLGLDVRRYDEDGTFETPWSLFESKE